MYDWSVVTLALDLHMLACGPGGADHRANSGSSDLLTFNVRTISHGPDSEFDSAKDSPSRARCRLGPG